MEEEDDHRVRGAASELTAHSASDTVGVPVSKEQEVLFPLPCPGRACHMGLSEGDVDIASEVGSPGVVQNPWPCAPCGDGSLLLLRVPFILGHRAQQEGCLLHLHQMFNLQILSSPSHHVCCSPWPKLLFSDH